MRPYLSPDSLSSVLESVVLRIEDAMATLVSKATTISSSATWFPGSLIVRVLVCVTEDCWFCLVSRISLLRSSELDSSLCSSDCLSVCFSMPLVVVSGTWAASVLSIPIGLSNELEDLSIPRISEDGWSVVFRIPRIKRKVKVKVHVYFCLKSQESNQNFSLDFTIITDHWKPSLSTEKNG